MYQSRVIIICKVIYKNLRLLDLYLRSTTKHLSLSRLLIIVILLFWYFFPSTTGPHPVGGRDPKNFDENVIEDIVLKLEYLVILTREYVNHGGNLPREELEISSAFQFFRTYLGKDNNFEDYIMSLTKEMQDCKIRNSDNSTIEEIQPRTDDVITRLAIRLVNSDSREFFLSEYLADIPRRNFFLYGYNPRIRDVYCFFQESGDAIYVGVSTQRIIIGAGSQEFLLVITAMLEGEYFQDFDGTPYAQGPVLIKKISL